MHCPWELSWERRAYQYSLSQLEHDHLVLGLALQTQISVNVPCSMSAVQKTNMCYCLFYHLYCIKLSVRQSSFSYAACRFLEIFISLNDEPPIQLMTYRQVVTEDWDVDYSTVNRFIDTAVKVARRHQVLRPAFRRQAVACRSWYLSCLMSYRSTIVLWDVHYRFWGFGERWTSVSCAQYFYVIWRRR